MRVLTLSLFLLVATLSPMACVEADLGDTPVYCNQWEPRCPEGYSCVPLTRDGKTEEVCRREGQTPAEGGDGGLGAADGM